MKYEKKCNPLANAVYDQVIEEFISGDTSCFFQTLVMLEDLNKSAIKEFMQGYLTIETEPTTTTERTVQ